MKIEEKNTQDGTAVIEGFYVSYYERTLIYSRVEIIATMMIASCASGGGIITEKKSHPDVGRRSHRA